MDQEKSPTYGLQSIGFKKEAPNDEEEEVPMQIVYRCPHKRGEGGRCTVKETDLNLLLNHFYKHHARERILKKSTPKFAMCCFRENCPSKFQNHGELVEHMWEHDHDPAKNIYFTQYIKELFEKENKDLGIDNRELSHSVKELKEEANFLKADRKMLQADNSKMKETTELKMKNKDLELKLKMKDLRKQETELKDLKEDKDYYRNKYHSEQKKNKEFKAEIDENGIAIEKQKELIVEHQEKCTRLTTKINLKDVKIKELEAIIEANPSSSTNLNQNVMNKELEEKDKLIKDMKRKEKILKKQVLKLNKKLLNSWLKKSCSSDSDESVSDSDNKKDGKKLDKYEKRKNNNPDSGLNEGRKNQNPSQSSSDESSDTGERNKQKKRKLNRCTQSPEMSAMNQDYVEDY